MWRLQLQYNSTEGGLLWSEFCMQMKIHWTECTNLLLSVNWSRIFLSSELSEHEVHLVRHGLLLLYKANSPPTPPPHYVKLLHSSWCRLGQSTICEINNMQLQIRSCPCDSAAVWDNIPHCVHPVEHIYLCSKWGPHCGSCAKSPTSRGK